MTTENIIYKPLRDTEVELKTRLANGEFGFTTDTSAIVFKSADGTKTETFRNPTGDVTKISSGTEFPLVGLEENLVFILTETANDGLYIYSEISAGNFDWVAATPQATTTKSGTLSFTDKFKINNIEATATTITNTLVPVITATTGGKLSDANAVKFEALSNTQSDFNTTVTTENSFIKNKPTELANINSTEGAKLTAINIKDATPGNGLIVTDGVISLNEINLSDTEVFTTKALRNADTTTTWHKGDVAIITSGTTKGSYIYSGTDQTTAGVTTDSDWTHLVTPTDVVSSVEGKTGIVVLDEATNARKGLATAAQITAIETSTTTDTTQNTNITANANDISDNAADILKLETTNVRTSIDLTNMQTIFSDGTDPLTSQSYVDTKNTAQDTLRTNKNNSQDTAIALNTLKKTNVQSDITGTTVLTGQIKNLPVIGTAGQILSVNSGATGLEYINNAPSAIAITPVSILPIGFETDGTQNLVNGHIANLNTVGLQIGGGTVGIGTRFWNQGIIVPAIPAGNSRIDININKTLFSTSFTPNQQQIALGGFTAGTTTLGGVATRLILTTSPNSSIFRGGTDVFYFDNESNTDTWLSNLITIINGDANSPITASLVDDETDSVIIRLQWPTNSLLTDTIVEASLEPGRVRQPGFDSFDFTNGAAVDSVDSSRWF